MVQVAVRESDHDKQAAKLAELRASWEEAAADYESGRRVRPSADLSELQEQVSRLRQAMEEARGAWEAEVAAAQVEGEEEGRGRREAAEWSGRAAMLRAKVDKRWAAVAKAMGGLGEQGVERDRAMAVVERRRTEARSQVGRRGAALASGGWLMAGCAWQVESAQRAVDVVAGELATVRAKLSGVNETLGLMAMAGGSMGEEAAGDACPTCGQEWGEEGRGHRREHLRAEAQALMRREAQLKRNAKKAKAELEGA